MQGIKQDEVKKILKTQLERFPFLARAYRNARDGWQMLQRPKITPFGFKLAGNAAMQTGLFEPRETEVFRQLAQNAEVVINAGAHVGYYCLHALSLGKHVVAFEPVAPNVKCLLKNIAGNGWQDRAEVFPLALAEQPGILNIYGGGTGASLVPGWAGHISEKATLVPASSLDVVLGGRFQGKKVVVLIDTEGSEYRILQGAETLLASEPKPLWMVEVTVSEHQPAGTPVNPHLRPTFELFSKHGYAAYGIGEKLELLSKEHLQKFAGGEKLFASSNFVFLHKSSRDIRQTLNLR